MRCFCERVGEVDAPGESVGGIFREGDSKHRVEGRQIGAGVRQCRGSRLLVVADYGRWVGLRE
jgi:hypothetical protein